MIENLFQTIFFGAFSWIILLGLIFILKIKLPEKILSEMVKFYSLAMVTLSFLLFIVTFIESPSFLTLDYHNWLQVGDYSFGVKAIVDLLGATYAFLSTALIGIIFRFSRNYLHKEEGYFRFVFLLSILMFGLIIVSFSRTLDLLFAGWEMVGTASVLLIGYFYSQNQPVKHATKAIISYRLCDMGILAAYSWAHLYMHTTDFLVIPNALGHAHGAIALYLIGLFVIWASLAKAGQLPMSSWLPTAMEGPTPSSAIFYGALSVHLGPFLLLRFYPYLKNFPSLLVIMGVIGGVSAIYATMVGRTRSDAKTMLAYSTISQVGIMYIEIALGFTNFVLFHIVAHASLRTYQYLRSSSVIQDFYDNPTVVHNQQIKRSLSLEMFVPSNLRKKIYVHALHGFHLDYFTKRIIDIICFPAKTYISWEKKWMELDNKVFRKLLGKG